MRDNEQIYAAAMIVFMVGAIVMGLFYTCEHHKREELEHRLVVCMADRLHEQGAIL